MNLNTELSEQAKQIKAAYHKDWTEKNKDHVKEYQAKWRAENRDKIKEYNRNYWEKKAAEQ